MKPRWVKRRILWSPSLSTCLVLLKYYDIWGAPRIFLQVHMGILQFVPLATLTVRLSLSLWLIQENVVDGQENTKEYHRTQTSHTAHHRFWILTTHHVNATKRQMVLWWRPGRTSSLQLSLHIYTLYKPYNDFLSIVSL